MNSKQTIGNATVLPVQRNEMWRQRSAADKTFLAKEKGPFQADRTGNTK